MHDLRDLMKEAVAGVASPSDLAVEADVRRGRRARARLARRRTLVPAGLAAGVAAVLAFSVAGIGDGTGNPAPHSSTISVALTTYQGKQPKGFSLDKVPVGWDVLAADAGRLVLADEGASNRDPNEFGGKILVMVANEAELSTKSDAGKPVKVGDVTGTLDTYLDGDPRLWVPSGKYTLIFQFPDNFDWDTATIIEFAAGVHLTGTPEIAGG
ncbi:hypothetical protein GCM10022223_14330 [Kineosporia mesophila]|uniref:DUF4352 domain-containing protein n=1 Tax=Kineosporia mesophila TaxID=566012 RepID=A0ABP6Z760_9ACTN|nr:hypothetical protein [Kineosporia mesophila]MCD5352912.1 hypothetical protein [Kineosporia mesophila]